MKIGFKSSKKGVSSSGTPFFSHRKRNFPGYRIALALLLVLTLALGAISCGAGNAPTVLTLATTTSTYDSGLLDAIVPPFEQAYNVEVKIVAVGTGQAIKLGQNGDCDVLLVHDPAQEENFMAGGYGVDREPVCYNDFIIVGPQSDPAGIRGMTDAAAAFAQIAQYGRNSQVSDLFISRGDGSGTNGKEKAIWQKAGITPSTSEAWYRSIGQGMGETLTFANEKLAYTLSDRATFLSRPDLQLVILVQGDSFLFNQYHVIAVNPEKHPSVNYNDALNFINYLTSVQTQQQIKDFGVDKYGQILFYPNSSQWIAIGGR